MPLLTKKPKAAPVVDVAGKNTAREVTLQFPPFKKLSDSEITALEEQEGKDVLAICDITGEPIFNQKNINVIQNPERPEMHGKVICSKVLTKLLEANAAMNGTASAKSSKK